MRLALISDLHGNELALDVILADAQGAGFDQLVCLGDVATLGPRPGKILSLTYCGPHRVAAGSSDNVVRVWDTQTGTETARLVGHTGSVSTLAWDASAGALISGSFDTTVRVWPVKVPGASTISHR